VVTHRIYIAFNLPSSGFLILQVAHFNDLRQYMVCQDRTRRTILQRMWI